MREFCNSRSGKMFIGIIVVLAVLLLVSNGLWFFKGCGGNKGENEEETGKTGEKQEQVENTDGPITESKNELVIHITPNGYALEKNSKKYYSRDQLPQFYSALQQKAKQMGVDLTSDTVLCENSPSANQVDFDKLKEFLDEKNIGYHQQSSKSK